MEGIQEWLSPDVFMPVITLWGGRLLAAIAIFVIGRWVIGILIGALTKAMARAQVDDTLSRFLTSIARITLLIFVILTALSALTVPVENFLVILGAAGLAIGLALKDSLSNFSSGVMLVGFRPFKAGDWIEAAGVSGSVESIRIFNTVIKTGDNRVVIVPNGLVYGGTITNYSAESTRRIDMTIGISYDDDIQRAKQIIMDVLVADARVLEDPAPVVLLMELGESSVNFAVRPWVASGDYWVARSDLLERLKLALEQEGLSIPYPQRDVHIVSQAAANA